MQRLLLIGAFPYPLAQGSQVYLQEQAQALRAAGDEITLLTYGQRRAPAASEPSTTEAPATTGRALDGLEHRTAPLWTVPRRTASGPGWGKPLADLGLAMTLRDALASKSGAARYDAVLTHNAEACVIALGVRQIVRQARAIPIVYCAHTLLGAELPTYLNPRYKRINRNSSRVPGALWGRLWARLGEGADRWLARHADAWIALTHSTERVMRRHSIAPGELIRPPMVDPETESSGWEPELPLASGALEPGSYFLYSGNLDSYQDLALLRATAERLAATGDSLRIVVATHDTRARRRAALGPGIEIRRVESAAEAQALLAGARASLLTRRTVGGFPIKLVNSLALGIPPIALRAREWGLEHGRNAWIGSLQDPVGSLCKGIRLLSRDDELARRLSRGARALYLAEHDPQTVAERTHGLLEQVIGRVRC
jgi:glycosyltransferase involved in cell wall biosynthesis